MGRKVADHFGFHGDQSQQYVDGDQLKIIEGLAENALDGREKILFCSDTVFCSGILYT